MVATAAVFLEFADVARPRIDAALDAATDVLEGCPPRLREAIRYSLLAPGKRLRPLLALLAAEATAGQWLPALPAACAVEMVHVYSLVHDDLPAMDDDDLRRGQPTSHKVFGEALAILAGDALLALAFETLAQGVRPPAVAAVCCGELAVAAGATALVGGQADDLEAAALPRDLQTLQRIHRRKTGAMINVALRLGARAAGARDDALEMLDRFGRRLGLAFQITDDLLDVRGDQGILGKRVGKDSVHGKLTFPSLLGVESSAARAESLVGEACAALAPLGDRAARLVSLAHYVLERDR